MQKYDEEYEQYLASLLKLDKEEIIQQAYKIHLLEEIVLAIDCLNKKEINISIIEIYEQWLKYDDNLSNEVKKFIETILMIKEQKNEKS